MNAGEEEVGGADSSSAARGTVPFLPPRDPQAFPRGAGNPAPAGTTEWSPQKSGPSPDSAPPKIQFSLRTLLLLPVAVACVLAVLFAKPPGVAILELLAIAFLLPAALTATIVYGKGYTRAFCIGALFPAGVLYLLSAVEFIGVISTASISALAATDEKSVVALRSLCGGVWLAAILSGSLCVGLRWILQRTPDRDGSARRHSWGPAVFVVLLVLLVLSGPIIGRIGIFVGWWEAGEPTPVATMPSYSTYPAPTATSPYATTPVPPVAEPSGGDSAKPPSSVVPADAK